ncbi:MAG: arsenite methyltransferase, partial [Anaerolineaceae bacterium]|nr:arsenite methyltransferase [Anaerolineaceae bacterium]
MTTRSSEEYFNQIADQWDNLRTSYFTEDVRESAIAKAYLRPEMIVADVGAGTGFMAAGLATRVQQVHVVDTSAAMLEVARKNLAQFDNIEYHQGEALSLPLPDESVDIAFANMYLHHCIDPLGAIREMARIVKPGGRLVITDMDAHNHAWMKTEMSDVWQGFEREQVRTWLKDAGLVNLLVDCTGQSCCAGSQAKPGQSVAISIFVAIGTRRIAMRDAVQSAYAYAAMASCGCTPVEASGSSACCSSGTEIPCCSSGASASTAEVVFSPAYSDEERGSVPEEVEQISLGCGNPIAMANLRPGEVVVDIGSGGGIDSFLAAGRVGATGLIIGVDMTREMLKRARAAARKAGIRNVQFRYGQAEALPVEDATADVVISNCVVNLCEDKGQVFAEAFRVLKAGGRLELSDMVSSGAFPLAKRHDAGAWAGCVSGALPEQEYLDLIGQAGFEAIRTRRSASAGKVGD